MVSREFWMNKIWGSWTAKIAAGTYGMPSEGKSKERIQSWNPPITGWMSRHKQIINDDEQYELIALLALESLSDKELRNRKEKGDILDPNLIGKFWKENLNLKLVFTAEKSAFENAVNAKVPWDKAGEEIYNNRYQNPYFDWIGAQMKGEIFGMLSPAWGWHEDAQPKPENDLKHLKACLDLSLQDALVAHRNIGVIGELFVSAMVAVGMDYNPLKFHQKITYPKSSLPATIISLYLHQKVQSLNMKDEEIQGIGISAEILITDIQRIKQALLLYEKIDKAHVETYFSFIDPIIAVFLQNPDAREWETAWKTAENLWKNYDKYLRADAKKRLGHNKQWLADRERTFKKHVNVHTLFNNSVIVIALLYGDGDITQTIQRATECGIDADCNAGNAGAILGAYLGNDLIPPYLKRFIRGEIISSLTNWPDQSLEKLANRVLIQAERLISIK